MGGYVNFPLSSLTCISYPVNQKADDNSGDKTLVVASFFFWRWGSQHQRSLTGLFQTLLHDVLEQRPNLIPEVLPDLWLEASRSPGWDPTNLTRNRDHIRLAFSRLLQCATIYEDTKICFFIDGLDEFEETLQSDHKELVLLLARWVQAAPNGVKLCVSSREYNVFLNFFSADKRLRLQDLTCGDMKRYSRERLHDLGQDLDRIVQVIAEKSNGIFLWAALVVKSIRARLEDGFDTSMVEEEVNSLPEELEDLFRHLLDSISKLYQKQAYQTFAMVQLGPSTASHHRPILTLVGYSFLGDYSVDPEFAQQSDFPFDPLLDTTRLERENNSRKRLNAYCRGLVETGPMGDLIYTHRSVVEFLGRHLQHTTAKAMLLGFEPLHALSQLMLAELRSRPRDQYWTSPTCDERHAILTTVVLGIMEARHAKRLDFPPYPFLEAFRIAANHAILPEDYPWSWYDGDEWVPYKIKWDLDTYWLLSSVVLNASVKLGLHQYFDWLTSADPTIINNACIFERSGMVWGSVGLNLWEFPRWPEDPDYIPFGVLSVLLKRGISPGALIFPSPRMDCYHLLSNGTSMWAHLMLVLFCFFPDPVIAEAGRVIQDFLEHGANPSMRVALKRGISGLFFKFKFENQLNSIRLPLPVNFQIPPDWDKAPSENHLKEEIRYHTWFSSKGGKVSFEDFVEFNVNVHYQRAGHISERATSPHDALPLYITLIFSITKHASFFKGSQSDLGPRSS